MIRPERPLGLVGTLDVPWGRRADRESGEPITAEVIAVDPERRQVWLSTAATENSELWAFLKATNSW
jgi:hypothetical protein